MGLLCSILSNLELGIGVQMGEGTEFLPSYWILTSPKKRLPVEGHWSPARLGGFLILLPPMGLGSWFSPIGLRAEAGRGFTALSATLGLLPVSQVLESPYELASSSPLALSYSSFGLG